MARSKSIRTSRSSQELISTYDERTPPSPSAGDLAVDLSQPDTGNGPGTVLDQLHEFLPAHTPGQGPQEHPAAGLYARARADVAVPVPDPDRDRHPVDVLLRALDDAGLRPDARPARHGGVRHLPPEYAPLVGARHGGDRVSAHVPGVPDGRLQ